MEYLINFKNMNWETPVPGIRQKIYVKEAKKIRLVEFTEEFIEENWCTNGHIGYVLEGNIIIDFNGKEKKFMAGQGLFIPKGEKNKHKAKINKGEKALIILFEEL
ncbi:MAG: cupin domain-containing protein [Candidatus Hodarchaeota archaeon]